MGPRSVWKGLPLKGKVVFIYFLFCFLEYWINQNELRQGLWCTVWIYIDTHTHTHTNTNTNTHIINIYKYKNIYMYIKRSILPVSTVIYLCQLMHLGTWCMVYYVVIITSAKLHTTKPELRFCSGLNPTRGLSEIWDDEDHYEEIHRKKWKNIKTPHPSHLLHFTFYFLLL